MRFSLSVTTRRCCRPATTRSSALLKSVHRELLVPLAPRPDRGLVADVRQVGAGQPGGLAGDRLELDAVRERLAPGVDGEDVAAALQVGRLDEDLAVEAARPEQRRVEILQAVRRAHHDDLVARAEPVELDEELVQRLILLAVEAVAAPRLSDGVELVDEDDRRARSRALPRRACGCAPRRVRRTSRRTPRRSARRSAHRTRSRRPWRRVSCRCREGRGRGCLSGRARPAPRTSAGRAGSRRSRPARPSPRRVRPRRPR